MKLEFKLEGKVVTVEAEGRVSVTVCESQETTPAVIPAAPSSVPAVGASAPSAGVGGGTGAGGGQAEDPLFLQLADLRTRLAAEQGVPPYVVFQDKSLREMASQRPQDPESFGRITGVGQAKLDKYAAQFLAVLKGGE